MPVVTSYPGIYIQELPSNTHTIAAAPTSVTVFVGYVHPFKPAQPNFGTALEIFSFSDYERLFGGFYESAVIDANVSYAVNEFFQNGGTDAFVVGLQPTTYYGSASSSSPALIFDRSESAGIGFVSLQPLDVPGTSLSITIDNVKADLVTADIKVSYGVVTETYPATVLANIATTINGAPSKLVTVQAGEGILGGSAAFPTAYSTVNYSETQTLPTPIVQGTETLAQSGIGFTPIVPTDQSLIVTISNVRKDSTNNLTIADVTVSQGGLTETFPAASLNATDTNFITTMINTGVGSISKSKLVTVAQDAGGYPAAYPSSAYTETEKITGQAAGAQTVLDKAGTIGIQFTTLTSTAAQTLDVTIDNIQKDTSGNLTIADITVSQNGVTEKYSGSSLSPTAGTFIPTAINGTSKLVTVAPDTVYPPVYPNATSQNGSITGEPAGSEVVLGGGVVGIQFKALAPTDAVRMTVTINNVQAGAAGNLTTADLAVIYGGQTEVYRKISLNSNNNPNFIETRVNGVSALVTVSANPGYPPAFPAKTYAETQTIWTPAPAGAVGVFSAADFLSVFQEDSSLDKVQIFNLLLTPGIVNNAVLSEALAFCERKLAFFIMDPPKEDVADPPTDWIGDFLQNATGTGDTDGNVAPQSPNGALYFPYLLSSDPVTGLPTNAGGNAFTLPPSGYVAGIFAATDTSRGVWKAPAGYATTLLDTTGVVTPGGLMTDSRQGVLNLIGVNCIRSFPGAGTVVFGARTLVSANTAFQQWKYVPVRRMALFLEQTLKANLTWVIFEPNDDPLWVAIRISIESFMMSLFNQGAFAGTTPSDAFQVKCDSTTTTPDDQANGVVNIIVAFAPLRPAEFVVVKIAQLAGQAQS